MTEPAAASTQSPQMIVLNAEMVLQTVWRLQNTCSFSMWPLFYIMLLIWCGKYTVQTVLVKLNSEPGASMFYVNKHYLKGVSIVRLTWRIRCCKEFYGCTDLCWVLHSCIHLQRMFSTWDRSWSFKKMYAYFGGFLLYTSHIFKSICQ